MTDTNTARENVVQPPSAVDAKVLRGAAAIIRRRWNHIITRDGELVSDRLDQLAHAVDPAAREGE